MSELITTEVTDGVATLTLNRPKAINAMNLEMIRAVTQTLHDWAADEAVESVELRGAGERGFSSGADVRELSSTLTSGGDWLGWLSQEYGLQEIVDEYPKPVTSHLYGIAMGGGLGFGAPAARRLVDSTTHMAMPETKLGWFPDAGMMYYLSRAGAVGTHCALTSAPFGGGDAILMGIADESVAGELPAPLHEAGWIIECYDTDDVLEVVSRLESHSHPDAHIAAREMRQRSPLAVHVAMRALRAARYLEHSEVLAQDLFLSSRLLPIDFPEGVRSLLVDKDNNPEWRHERLEDVPGELVDEIFAAAD